MGHAAYFCTMFIRRNRNRSGSISVQIVQKDKRTNKIVKTIGVGFTEREVQLLIIIAKNELIHLQGLQSLFVEKEDLIVESFVSGLYNSQISIAGPQLILSPVYSSIGYPDEPEDNYFKHLVLSRLIYPGSKLETIKYLRRHYNIDVSVQTIYRYLDELDSKAIRNIQQLTFNHTREVLKGNVGVVFYDMTTLYFEAPSEDDLRKIGYSKDGKHQHPQIMLGLLVGKDGYPLGYDIFQGNQSETKTLIPILKSFQQRFNIEKPIVVADCALLSKKNIEHLSKEQYTYIIGGKIKNEAKEIKEKILALDLRKENPQEIEHRFGRMIISFSAKRKKKDRFNREKGLKRLEAKVKSGKLNKESINNRGYNKYLVLDGKVYVKIDYEKFNADQVWDGLKGYTTNTDLEATEVIEYYSKLWMIEKAFRISKTDLKIRPIYHRKHDRIKAHICICFAAYAIYKELERKLQKYSIGLSTEKAIKIIKDIHQLTYQLPKSGQVKTKILNLDKDQEKLFRIVKS